MREGERRGGRKKEERGMCVGKERKGEGKTIQLTSQLLPAAPCPVNSPVVTGSLSAEQQSM